MLTHLYGASVASLFTFHSYRSGLATALAAAGVDDARIMLICRWMCPASLHVYRRHGLGDADSCVRRARAVPVQALQNASAPRVSNDENYAEIEASFNGLSLSREASSALAAAQVAATAPGDAQRTSGQPAVSYTHLTLPTICSV